MKSSLYRRLWSFNAIVIAAAGVLALVAVAAVLVGLWRSNQHEDLVRPETRGGDGALYVVAQEHARRSPYVALMLGTRGMDFGSDDAGSDYRDLRNVLLLNEDDGTTRHVLPDTKRRISQWRFLPGLDDSPDTAYYALVESRERGSDGGQLYDLLVGTPEGKRQAWIARGVTSISDPDLLDGDSLGVLVWRGRDLTYLKVDLADLRLQLSRKIELKAAGN